MQFTGRKGESILNLATFLNYIKRYEESSNLTNTNEAEIYFDADYNNLIFEEPNCKIIYDLDMCSEAFLYDDKED